MRRLGIRGRLLGAAVASVTVALCVLVVAFNVVLGRRLASDTDSLLRARAAAELSGLRLQHGRLVPRDPYEAAPTVWVFAGTRAIEIPSAPAVVGRTAAAMAGAPPGFRDVAGEVRLLSVPVVDGGRRVGTVVASVSLDPANDARVTALVGSTALGAAFAVVFALGARWILARALRPVARMTAEAAEWSEHDLDRRFQLGPPHDELAQLGATLDDMLARLSAALTREQRLSAEISHELRTPLARIQTETDLALRHTRSQAEYAEALAAIRTNAERMAAIIDTLMEAARREAEQPAAMCDVRAAAEAAAAASAALAAERAVRLEVVPGPAPARARVEQALVERTLEPLLENACRHARTRVTVAVAIVEDRVHVTVCDDGPGIAVPEVETVFQPGTRGAASGGAGLGLALARRLARAADGEVVADSGPGGRLIVILPAAGGPVRRNSGRRT
jgi:signal transduction histidine kinase